MNTDPDAEQNPESVAVVDGTAQKPLFCPGPADGMGRARLANGTASGRPVLSDLLYGVYGGNGRLEDGGEMDEDSDEQGKLRPGHGAVRVSGDSKMKVLNFGAFWGQFATVGTKSQRIKFKKIAARRSPAAQITLTSANWAHRVGVSARAVFASAGFVASSIGHEDGKTDKPFGQTFRKTNF